MDSMNDPIGFVLLKKFLFICFRELARIIRAFVTVLKRRILQGQWRPRMLWYPVVVLCLLLLLAIGGRRTYTDTTAGKITLTLDNGDIIPIRVQRPARAAYINVNTDSILYVIKNTTGTSCTGAITLNVPAGQPPVLTRLSDGTLVHLNVASRLSFPACFTGDQRVVELKGEAYFEVSPNAQQLFIVRTNGFNVKVIGTKFVVSDYPDDGKAQVALLEGDILFHYKNSERKMQAGQTLTLDRESDEINTGTVDRKLTAWRNGIYFFDGEPLGIICKNASRLYGVHIIIDGKQLANRRFSGAINRQLPIEEFLGYLHDTGNINYYYDAKKQLHLQN